MSLTTKILMGLLSVALTGTGSFVMSTSTRVSALEAHREDDSKRLDRIEHKIDQLIERTK